MENSNKGLAGVKSAKWAQKEIPTGKQAWPKSNQSGLGRLIQAHAEVGST